MSNGHTELHSHSGLERENRFPKHIVLIDVCFEELFADSPTQKFFYEGKEYLKVNILDFVKKGGIFKNLSE